MTGKVKEEEEPGKDQTSKQWARVERAQALTTGKSGSRFWFCHLLVM